MSKKKKSRAKKISGSNLIGMGFTDELIGILLPPPIEKYHEQTGKTTRSWLLKDALEAIRTETFVKNRNQKHWEHYQRVQKQKQNRQSSDGAPLQRKQSRRSAKAERRRQRERERMEREQIVADITELLKSDNPADWYPYARRMKRHFIIYVGPTNSGKTFRALQDLKNMEYGVYLGPLRLLALEVAERMNREGYPCNLVTGEECILVDGADYTASTVEKLNTQEQYGGAVIDECQMLTDRTRGSAWTRAILGVAAGQVSLCTAPEGLQLCISLIKTCGDTYEIVKLERNTLLEPDCAVMKYGDLQKGDAVIAFSRKRVIFLADDLKEAGFNPSVIYGALPYEARRKQVEQFLSGETDIVVATDAIGMGMNLPIARVVFTETMKFNGKHRVSVAPEEVRQIAGRAGRLGLYEKGKYTAFGEEYLAEIREKMEQEITVATTIPVPFPDILISYQDKGLLEMIDIWRSVPFRAPFVPERMEDVEQRIKYLMKDPQIADAPRKTVYQFAILPWDVSGELGRKMMRYAQNYLSGKYEHEPVPFPLSLRVRVRNKDRQWLEYFSRCVDLYYSFCTVFELEMDEERVQIARQKIPAEINRNIRKARERVQVNEDKKKQAIVTDYR